MEYVRGKSLDALIPRQGMRLGEVLRISIPVADALAAAHGRGIVHRDLKPANVIVGHDGAVKVLDFGLAKLTSHDADPEERTVTHMVNPSLSVPGTIAGTAAYMSPEQATGGKVDARSDIFSFGAMLYEMVTGQRAFAGQSSADTLAAVLRTQPKLPSDCARGVPIDLEKIILRCLRKDPTRRFQHMDDVKVALQDVEEDSQSGSVPALVPPRRRRGRLIAVLVGTVFIVGAGAIWLVRMPKEASVSRARIRPLTTLPGNEYAPTFSPDGSQVAFAGYGENPPNGDIYVTVVGSSDVRRLTTDPAFDGWPSWSRVGRQIAYVREIAGVNGGRIHVVSPLGGTDRTVSDFPASPALAWAPDGQYVAAGRAFRSGDTDENRGIYLIPLQGGPPLPLTQARRPAFHTAPAFSPDGRQLAYCSCSDGCNVYLVQLNAASRPAEPPRRLTPQSVSVNAIGSLAWTRDGASLIYDAGTASSLSYLWRVPADGRGPPERIEFAGNGANTPATAPSHDRLAFARASIDIDVYRFEVGRPGRPMLSSTYADIDPDLSPDGRRLAFSSARSGDSRMQLWVSAADGSGAQPLNLSGELQGSELQGSPSWGPDGHTLAIDAVGADGHHHIWTVDADGGTPRRLTDGPDPIQWRVSLS
jgi:eukaryotic-like serine/threonine-protein kinase